MPLASLSLIFLTLTACAKSQPEPVIESEIVVEPERPIGPDPAEVYCTGLGYDFITRKREIDKQLQTQIPIETTPEVNGGLNLEFQ
jgi:hypothetical protein